MGSWVTVAAVLAVGAELLPPNNPVKDGWSPRWHLPAASHMAAGDVNALFHWKGTWHLMSQWEMEVGGSAVAASTPAGITAALAPAPARSGR